VDEVLYLVLASGGNAHAVMMFWHKLGTQTMRMESEKSGLEHGQQKKKKKHIMGLAGTCVYF
jgi:hypothetical protein